MSETWQITLFSGIGAILCGIIVAGVALAFVLSNRITRIETQFEDWLDRCGLMAAKALHSPDNHLGIDYFLDQYVNNSFDMADQDWVNLREVCASTMQNPSATKLEQVQAEFLKHLADHKLQRIGNTHSKKLVL